jgi:chromosome segregation ATPase
MNEQQEIEQLDRRFQSIKKRLNSLEDFNEIEFDKLDKHDRILSKLEREMEELQNDYAVVDFLINGSRMATCPEK